MSGYNTGIASEYFILSQLYRLGYEAYITIGNKKSIDIRIIKDDKTITLDVKGVQGYSSLIVNNVTYKSTHFIAFVIYNNSFSDLSINPEVYIVPSIDIPNIQKIFGTQKRVFKGKLLPYKDKWESLFTF